MENTFINKSNQEIWGKCIAHFDEIKVMQSEYSWAYNNVFGNSATIFMVDKSQSTFNHELLHLYLISLGISVTGLLYYSANRFESLSHIDIDWWDQTANLLNHVLMLPEYLDMGNKREEFICDFFESKANVGLINQIKKWGVKDSTTYQGRQALAKDMMQAVFAMRSCPNVKFNYTLHYKTLKSAEPIIYGIANGFWTDWHTVDIHNEFHALEARNTVDALMNKLNNYIINKI